MRKILVAGNWKMNASTDMVRTLLQDLVAGTAAEGGPDMAVFPPFPYLAQTQSLLDGSSIDFGAQTLNPIAKGAHTGEVSASMLTDLGLPDGVGGSL